MKRRNFLAVAASVGVGAATGAVASAKEGAPEEKRSQVYKCAECGTVVEILEPGMAPLVHCGKPMTLMVEKSGGEGAAKHVPVVEKIAGGYKVKVGATAHPMLASHHIAWIDLLADGKAYRQFLEVGKPAEATFPVEAETVTARAHCNLHGVWKNA